VKEEREEGCFMAGGRKGVFRRRKGSSQEAGDGGAAAIFPNGVARGIRVGKSVFKG
jgi:hypothetical protein